MKDRIAQNPNRIGLTDENGVKKIYTLSREDNPTQEGTKLNKANLLSDTTASLLGLTNPTVNDYLANIINGGFKGFWWKKQTPSYSFSEVGTDNYLRANDSSAYTLYYFDDFVVDINTLEIKAKNDDVHSVEISPDTYTNANITKGKYFCYKYPIPLTSSNKYEKYLCYCKPNTTISLIGDINSFTLSYSPNFEKMRNPTINWALSDYVCSSNINAYPNGDYQDGYYYELDKSVVVDKVYKWKKGTPTYIPSYYLYAEQSGTGYTYIKTLSQNKLWYSSELDYAFDETTKQYKLKLKNPIELELVDKTTYNELDNKFISIVSADEEMDYAQKLGHYEQNNNYYPYFAISNSTKYLNFAHYWLYKPQTTVELTNISYVNSLNENAYPNGGTQDGYYYGSRETINLGGAKCVSGSYVGTNTYGASNPNSLTFDFEPKIIIITQSDGWLFGTNYCFLAINPTSTIYTYSGYACRATWGNNSITYYSTDSANAQMNANITYYYIAIG